MGDPPTGPPFAPGDPGTGSPAGRRRIAEPAVTFLAFLCILPPLCGSTHWVWQALGGVLVLVLLVLVIHKFVALRRRLEVELPPARKLPPGSPEGRRLSRPPEGA